MHSTSYIPLRPVEPRPPILPAPAPSNSSENYRLPATIAPAPPNSNGSTSANAEAGPSSSNNPSAAKRRVGLANAKKRRANAPLEDTAQPDGTQRSIKQRESPKKKKAQRACAHCQKAHLTCDDSRPCQRCIKRGMADKCIEGQRKKAKYLLDEAELEALKHGNTAQQHQQQPQPPHASPPMHTVPSITSSAPAVEQFPQNDIYFNMIDQPYGFGSEAANLEYSSLSAILGVNNYSPENNFLSSETPPASAVSYGQQFANTAWPAEPQHNVAPQSLVSGNHPMAPVTYDSYNGVQNSQQAQAMQNGMPYLRNGQLIQRPFFNAAGPSGIGIDAQQNGRDMILPVNTSPEVSYTVPDVRFPQQTFSQASTGLSSSMQTHSSSSGPPPSTVPSSGPSTIHRALNTESPSVSTPPSGSPMSTIPTVEMMVTAPLTRQGELASDVYAKVTKSYSYIKSYQFLMSFLYKKFQKNDMLRVIRALAIYRPSMIALQTPMSEEDFVFMEKCLRRSLIELEKLISYTGTPTVVWRRTGEICLVGVEFCLMTEWKKEDLVEQKYIYELFENQSVIEYWEKFASHAFENTTTSVFSHCVLLKPSGEPVPCTFCFSIRRDLFDLPSVVIGQWLPLM